MNGESSARESKTQNENPNKSSIVKNMCNEFLANVVFVFHCLVVAFVVLVPLTYIPALHIIHITFSISLLVHWYCNSNVCSLSMIESKLRGLDYTESFTHRLIGPVYEISKTAWSRFCYIFTILLLCISLYKLVNSTKWKQAWDMFNKKSLEFKNQDKEISWRSKIMTYICCFEPLFRL